MTLYQYFKKNNKKIGELHSVGLISTAKLNDFETYQYYLDQRDLGVLPTKAVSMSMDYFGLSRSGIYLIINKMEDIVV